MAAFLDGCRFNPTLGGTTDFIVSSNVPGYQTPALAGGVNARVYKWRAESADLSQWEDFEGTYTVSSTTVARTTVLYNSSGTGTGPGQSGAGTKITFSTVPQVACIALKEDLISIEEANSFTATQKAQAQSNIYLAPTRQVLTASSGTYTTPANVKWIEVEVCGPGGGGAGSGTTAGAGGNPSGATTFGSSLLTANAGTGGPTGGITIGGAGGTATGGDDNITGGQGDGGTSSTAMSGGRGGDNPRAGAGAGGPQNAAGGSAAANTGGGGGGAGDQGTAGSGSGGGAGGWLRKIITAPSATYAYSIPAGGSAGTAGTGGFAGGAGAAGIVVVTEHYGS